MGRQKTDTRDAEHRLDLLRANRFPRIWVLTPEERDVRQLLQHRSKLMRTSVKNPLHYLGMNQGVCRKRKLWTEQGRGELEALNLGPWASRRQGLLELLDGLEPRIEELDKVVKAEAERRPEVVRLMQEKGVGPVTALAFVLMLGPVGRFANSRKVLSYLGLNPREASSAGHRRLGHISNARQRNAALAAGGSGAERGAVRSRTAPQVSTLEVSARCQRGESGHGATTGGATVLGAPLGARRGTAGSHAR